MRQQQTVEQLTQRLDRIRGYYRGTRMERFRAHPLRTALSSVLGRFTNRWMSGRHPLSLSVPVFFGGRMSISVPPYLELLMAGAYASHDPEVRLTKWLIRNLREGSVFIDCGAHYGYYTCLAARLVGNTGKVVAVEPGHLVLPWLRRNVARYPNASLVEAGISDSEGTATFYEGDIQYSVISTMNPGNLDQMEGHLGSIVREVAITTTTIDTVATDFDPGIIKLDVEGAEAPALRGAKLTIERCGPAIALEVFLRPTDNDRLAVSLLKEYGYEMHSIVEDGTLAKVAYEDFDSALVAQKERYRAMNDDAIIDNMVFMRPVA